MTATLAPGVTQVATTRRDNAFLIDGDDGLTLVDVGWASASRRLLSVVADLGRKPSDIKRVVLTHAHADHVQGAGLLRRLTGARILVHHADARWLRLGRVPPDGRSGFLGRQIDRVPKAHWQPFEADATLEDGDLVSGSGGLRVIHTPGHSPGHIVLLHEPTRTLLAGDAVFNRGQLGLGPAPLAADPGAPLSGAGIESFHAFLEQLRRAGQD
jgi:glyoxylase-like metal-dependent hydrolase (beta-lactamase superfamily II)